MTKDPNKKYYTAEEGCPFCKNKSIQKLNSNEIICNYCNSIFKKLDENDEDSGLFLDRTGFTISKEKLYQISGKNHE